MRVRHLPSVLLLAVATARAARFDEAPHGYWDHTSGDRFARLQAAVAAGQASLDASSERAYLASLLRALEIGDSSQLLLYSATSLQSELINPRNPRALYFNDDTFVGYVPGGRFEIASFDPVLGMVFHLSERYARAPGREPAFARSDRCMNCHADTPSYRRPGLVIHSVAVTWDGSSLETYRRDEIGHRVPLGDRFGGWHLTGTHRLGETHANRVGELTPRGLVTEPAPPGLHFPLTHYPRATSDIAVHLVHEHQAGFINRVIHAIYLQREGGVPEPFLDELAAYAALSGEAPLPPGGVEGDADFRRDFRARDPHPGPSLRDLELRTRLFRHPASYMLTTPVWRAAPEPVRRAVHARLSRMTKGDDNRRIRAILLRSLPEIAADWPLDGGEAEPTTPASPAAAVQP